MTFIYTLSGLKAIENRIEDTHKIEKEIASEADVKPEEVILDPPETPSIEYITVKIKKNGEVKEFDEFSPIPKYLSEAEWRNVALKVYCPEKHIEKVSKAAENVLTNYKNILDKYFKD